MTKPRTADRRWPHATLPLALAAACAGTVADPPGPPLPAPPVSSPQVVCRELLQASPDGWAQRLPPVLVLGAPAATALVELLRADPQAPGAQAAVAALGRIGGDDAAAFLREQLAQRTELAAEAALSLGTRADAAATDALQATADDRLADATLRATCAASLLRLGVRQPVARLVRGVVLAGTPAGRDLQRELGLADKPRWAHERYLIQHALRQVHGDDFGLDADAPWPALVAAADRIDLFLGAR
jgi:hypothetical protein